MSVELYVDGQVVARYVLAPDVDSRLSPRPYLHPVTTLGGCRVTDVLPADHPHHLGASVAMQDVSGSNLWGGRTYVRGSGYEWRDDHGQITHERMVSCDDASVEHELVWRSQAGDVLLTERRRIAVRAVPNDPAAWRLTLTTELRASYGGGVSLGSPATNGRPGGAGYGGFFWRAPMAEKAPTVRTATLSGEDDVNGSAASWLEFTGDGYRLTFSGLDAFDRWFVRTSGYPGICAAWAFAQRLSIPPGATMRRAYTVVIADAP